MPPWLLVQPCPPKLSFLFGTLYPCLPGLTSKSKKGNSEGFLELAPRGLSVLGRSKREGGAEKGLRRKPRPDKGPSPPLKLPLTQEGG